MTEIVRASRFGALMAFGVGLIWFGAAFMTGFFGFDEQSLLYKVSGLAAQCIPIAFPIGAYAYFEGRQSVMRDSVKRRAA